ncbi:MAG TPA: LON peptidase substrate-binding domain-containing protein, partial [Methylomirabilota bacterium]
MPQVSLPIFPLPDLTFFPRTMLPLHIFEARYRAMITDCL